MFKAIPLERRGPSELTIVSSSITLSLANCRSPAAIPSITLEWPPISPATHYCVEFCAQICFTGAMGLAVVYIRWCRQNVTPTYPSTLIVKQINKLGTVNWLLFLSLQTSKWNVKHRNRVVWTKTILLLGPLASSTMLWELIIKIYEFISVETRYGRLHNI